MRAETDILVQHSDQTKSVVLQRIIRLINFLLWASGVGVVAIGIYINADLYYVDKLLRLPISHTCNVLLIASGSVLILFCLLTCFEYFFRRRLFLVVFSYLVTFVFVLQCIVVALAFTWRKEIGFLVEKELVSFISDESSYISYKSQRIALDNIQSRFHCCGAINYTDWADQTWLGNERNVPFTCCKSSVAVEDCKMDKPQNLYVQGCVRPLRDRYEMNYLIMGVFGILVAFFQFGCYHLTNYLMFNLE